LKRIFFFILFLFSLMNIFSYENYDIVFVKFKIDTNYFDNYKNSRLKDNTINFKVYLGQMEYYELKSEENLFRRAEIIFFGSLTVSAFASWMFMSLYNSLIYGETFGNLNRNQFLLLYLGAGTISISVSITDLFIKLKPKIKGVEIY
jgi:hypothetical protein